MTDHGPLKIGRIVHATQGTMCLPAVVTAVLDETVTLYGFWSGARGYEAEHGTEKGMNWHWPDECPREL